MSESKGDLFSAGVERLLRGLDPDNDPEAAYRAFQERYWGRPDLFAKECIDWGEGGGPTDYQLEIFRSVYTHRRVSVRGARGLGKSTMLAIIILWFCLTRDGRDWKIGITASQWFQLSAYLWPEIHKWARKLRWEEIGCEPWRDGKQILNRTIKLATGATATSSPEKPGGIEGAHAEHIMFIFDESKNIQDGLFDSVEGSFSGAGGDTGREAFACAFSTPGEPVGRFAEIHHRKPGLENWWVRHVTLEETIRAGRVSREWARAMRDLWGEESPLYRNHVLGEFAVTAHNAVIPLSWVEAAMDRWRDLYEGADAPGHPGPLSRIGVDVGGEVDDTVYALRYGRALHRLIVQKQPDQEVIAEEVMALMDEEGVRDSCVAVVDAIGVGSAVHKILRKRVKSVPFGAGEGTDMLDASGEFGFKNKRAALWWTMRELLDPSSGEDVALPPDDRLKGELILPTWREVAGGRIEVEEKAQIKKRNSGRSTDVADAALQAYWRSSSENRRARRPKARAISRERHKNKRAVGARVYRTGRRR